MTHEDLDARIAALTAAVEAMTPGPWEYSPSEKPMKNEFGETDTGSPGAVTNDAGDWIVVAGNELGAGLPEEDQESDLYGIVALRNTALPLIRQLRERLAAVEGELGKLAKFKAYVHKRLDDADVPNHPNPKTHDGCRIGARLDWCEANRKALVNQINLLTHKVITCGIAASHPDAELTRRLKCYAEDWNSPQADEVRALRAERDALVAENAGLRAERDDAHGSLRTLACAYAAGGYNAETVVAEVFEKKILDGVDLLIGVETKRREKAESQLAAALAREKGLRESLIESRKGIDWLAKEGCTVAEQAWSQSLLLRIDAALAATPGPATEVNNAK